MTVTAHLTKCCGGHRASQLLYEDLRASHGSMACRLPGSRSDDEGEAAKMSVSCGSARSATPIGHHPRQA